MAARRPVHGEAVGAEGGGRWEELFPRCFPVSLSLSLFLALALALFLARALALFLSFFLSFFLFFFLSLSLSLSLSLPCDLGVMSSRERQKSQFRVVVGLLFPLKGKNAVSAFLPFKGKKQPHDHPKL